MNTLPRLLVLFVIMAALAMAAARAGSSLDYALEAQARLGSEVWSQVIRIENKMPNDRFSKVVHALVFELADVLWFYNEARGT